VALHYDNLCKGILMKKVMFYGISLLWLTIISCSSKNETPSEPQPYASFLFNGVPKTYNYAIRFSKSYCAGSTYCALFSLKKDTAVSEKLKIGIPGEPLVGHVYQNGDQGFTCYYESSVGTLYMPGEKPFTVTFSRWDGQGGWGMGTFSGFLYSPDSVFIELRNGYFQNEIWSY
jgi:hypothetical protein